MGISRNLNLRYSCIITRLTDGHDVKRQEFLGNGYDSTSPFADQPFDFRKDWSRELKIPTCGERAVALTIKTLALPRHFLRIFILVQALFKDFKTLRSKIPLIRWRYDKERLRVHNYTIRWRYDNLRLDMLC
jgi:hypothetical protein